MRKLHRFSALMLAVGIAGAGSTVVSADTKVSLDDVPERVKQAALDAMPGIKLEEAEFEMERGVRVYELEGMLDGKLYEIEVTEDAEVLEIEVEDDNEIALSEVPLRVRKAAQDALPDGAQIVEAEVTKTKSRGVVYELEANVDGKEYEVLLTPDGRVLDMREESEDGDDDEDDDVETAQKR